MEASDGASGGASASARLAEAARRAFEAGDLAEARRALSDPSLESALVASGDRHRLAHARAVLEFHDGEGSVDELLERLRLAEADARDSAAARAASSPAARADVDVDGDGDVDGDASTRAATHAESDAFHDAFALRANLAWALQASGRAAASAEVLEDLFREIDAVDPSTAVRVCAMLVRAARRTGRLERASRVLDRAEAILRRAAPEVTDATDATDATETPPVSSERNATTADARPDASANASTSASASSFVFDPVATRAWISLERARLSLARARVLADVDDVSARLDALDQSLETQKEMGSDVEPETKNGSTNGWTRRRAFAAETRVLRAAAAATSGRAEDAARLLMDADETYLSSASGCANLAEVFRRAGRPAAASAASSSAIAKSTTPAAREDALAAAALAALTEGRHDDAEVAFESIAWKTPETWLRLAECAAARGTAAEAPTSRFVRREEDDDEEDDDDDDATGRSAAEVAKAAQATSTGAFERACRCLDVADALFSARARVDGERAYPASARAGVAANRAYANLRLGRPRAALAHAQTLSRLVGGWEEDAQHVEHVGEDVGKDEDEDASRRGFADDLTALERRGYARVGRCYAAEALFALGRFDESERTTRDAAARDDADFETLTHAARAAYALGDAVGAERLAKRAGEAAPNAAEPRLMAAFLRMAGGDPAATAAALVEKGR